ncbi:MAG TPA: diguanylate cyclase, partial [Azonexus sp.]|nr:diguanylate cyclase [Azonexus sp.]
MPSDLDDSWQSRKDRIIGLGERSFHKSYYPQLRQNLDRLERFRTLLDHTSDFVILVALPEGTITDVNTALGQLLGKSGETLIGTSFSSLGLGNGTDVLAELRQDMDLHKADEPMPGHSVVVEFPRDARPIWLELSYRVAMVDERCYGVMVGRDISERKQAEARINYLAYHDALTGLPNYLLLRDRLQQAVAFADRAASKLALLVIDLDQFKTINDSLGHAIGDKLLIAVAGRLTECAGGTATVSRQGGDEYLILLPNLADLDAMVAFIGKLMFGLQTPFLIEGRELPISASVGIAVFPNDGRDFDSLLKKADLAMYRAKDAGRNTYRFFNEDMNEDAAEQLTMHFGLRRGIDQGEFELYYQPQLEIGSGALLGAEALIRWN